MMASKLKVPATTVPGRGEAVSSSLDVLSHSCCGPEEMNDIVKRVTECLSINEAYPDVETVIKDRCVRNEVLGLIRDGLDDLSVLARRIEAALTPAALCGEATNKKELLKLSKKDEWFLVQEHLVAEEREAERQRLERKRKEQAAKQREHQDFLKQVKLEKEGKKREKARELEAMKQERRELEAEARRQRAARRQAGEAVRADRESQVKRAKDKQMLVTKLKKVVDDQEKRAVMASLRDERERIVQGRLQAQQDMQSVLKENQKTLEQKKLDDQKEKEEAIRCMQEYSKMLLHQEQQRQRQLERIQEIQRAQEQAPNMDIVAAGTKAWVDDMIVEKQAQQIERKAIEREEKAREAMLQRNDEMLKTLDQQVKEKLGSLAAERMKKATDKQRLADLDRESKENLQAARQRAADKCLALKRGLDIQIIHQRKVNRASVGMNRLERALNAQVLQKARGRRGVV